MLIVVFSLETVFSPVLHATDEPKVSLVGNGWTELHRLVGSEPFSASTYKNVDACLRRHPELRFTKTALGDTALHLLIEMQCMFGTIRNVDLRSDIVNTIKALVSKKYKVMSGKKEKSHINIKNDKGETALHLAAGYGIDYIITLLLEHGAKKEAITGVGNTPLDFAVWRGHLSSVRLLLNSGACCSQKTILRAKDRLDYVLSKQDTEGIEIYTAILNELEKHSKPAVFASTLYSR